MKKQQKISQAKIIPFPLNDHASTDLKRGDYIEATLTVSFCPRHERSSIYAYNDPSVEFILDSDVPNCDVESFMIDAFSIVMMMQINKELYMHHRHDEIKDRFDWQNIFRMIRKHYPNEKVFEYIKSNLKTELTFRGMRPYHGFYPKRGKTWRNYKGRKNDRKK